MPVALIMQDLVSVTLSASGQSITQAESLWPDLTSYQGLAVGIYFQSVPSSWTGSPAFYLESAPVKEESWFTQAGFGTILTVNSNPGSLPGWNGYGPYTSTSNPFFRYLRWRITNGTSGASNTWQFRIVLSATPSP